MPFQFAQPPPFRPGSLFLGVDDDGQEVGIATERHAITVAGSRSGKGAALIVPNLIRWPHSVIVVDTKGDNAAATWQARQDMGQAVHVLDPFREADIPDNLRASYNPLADLDPASPSIREDISVIADGLVLRHRAEDGEWYDGGALILAGFIAHALTTLPPEYHRLAVIRDMLNANGEDWAALLSAMEGNAACGGLAQSAAALLGDGAKSAREFLGTARRSIDKFGSDALQSCMAESSFRLSDLKAGRSTVFLVLPSRYVEEHARFFRLFVRLALNEMEKPIAGKSGPDRFKGTPCLFVLDEFFSLGRIDAVYKAAGRMAGNGVHLWPFLQDIGQLMTLYGRDGMETFFANADARIFFGNTDPLTLTNISAWLDRITPDEIAEQPPQVQPLHIWRKGRFFWNDQEARDAYQADMENLRAQHAHKMAMSGRARLSPPEVAALVAKKPGDAVARSMIVFGPGDDVFNLRLAPYFQPAPDPVEPSPLFQHPMVRIKASPLVVIGATVVWLAPITAFLFVAMNQPGPLLIRLGGAATSGLLFAVVGAFWFLSLVRPREVSQRRADFFAAVGSFAVIFAGCFFLGGVAVQAFGLKWQSVVMVLALAAVAYFGAAEIRSRKGGG